MNDSKLERRVEKHIPYNGRFFVFEVKNQFSSGGVMVC